MGFFAGGSFYHRKVRRRTSCSCKDVFIAGLEVHLCSIGASSKEI